MIIAALETLIFGIAGTIMAQTMLPVRLPIRAPKPYVARTGDESFAPRPVSRHGISSHYR
jgi:hypothetical protein